MVKSVIPLAGAGLYYTVCVDAAAQAFVFCCAHADLIQRYLAESKWAHSKDMKAGAGATPGGGGGREPGSVGALEDWKALAGEPVRG